MTDTKLKVKKLNNGHIVQKEKKHCFSISKCKTVPKFNENFKTKSNEGEEYQGIRTVITFEFENTSHVKKMLR